MPQSLALRPYGYQGFQGGTGPNNTPTHDECAGKIGRIVEVTNNSFPTISVEMEANGVRYQATAYGGRVNGIAFLDELDAARRDFIGKTLWFTSQSLQTYDPDTGETNVFQVKKFAPVKIVDVVAGWYGERPLRFIALDPQGREGFVDLNLSGTNAGNLVDLGERFEDHFLRVDPKTQHRWEPRVWAAIQDGKVFVGMTKEQATMSWGKPDDINTTTTAGSRSEQWCYGTESFLYFTGNLLTSIQN